MTAFPVPSDFENRTNATYDALMWALSRPGLARSLPQSGAGCIVETLIDRECSVYCDAPDMAQMARSMGAHMVAPEMADHLFLSDCPPVSMLGALSHGSDMYPDDGATLVMPAQMGAGAELRLSGPGVDGAVQIRIDGIGRDFWSERARVMRYPMGFEIFLHDGDQVIGLPRSTRVEVL